MSKNKEFSFRVTVLEAIDVPEQYTDVFCQFKYVIDFLKLKTIIII